MDKEIRTVLKKTAKIAGVTCFALSGAALVASGAALKALVEGAKYTRDSVKKILNEQSEEKKSQVVEAEVAPTQEEHVAPAEAEETAAGEGTE